MPHREQDGQEGPAALRERAHRNTKGHSAESDARAEGEGACDEADGSPGEHETQRVAVQLGLDQQVLSVR